MGAAVVGGGKNINYRFFFLAFGTTRFLFLFVCLIEGSGGEVKLYRW